MIRLLDHGLILLLLVVAPAWGAWEYRVLVREIRGGNAAARLRTYRSTLLLQWVFSAALLGVLLGLQRRASGGILGPILTHCTWSMTMLLVLPPVFAAAG